MRFLRGLGVGILCFIVVMVGGFVMVGNLTELDIDAEGNFVTIGEITFDRAMEEVPEWTIITQLAFFGMFIGPLYYWIIEPIREKRRTPRRTYYSTPQQQYYHPPSKLVGMK